MTMNIDTSTFTSRSYSPKGDLARAKLSEYIETGRRRALATYDHAMTNVIEDSLVRDGSMIFRADGGKRIVLDVDGQDFTTPLTEHALGQVCSRYGMPAGYARDLLANENPFIRDLAAENLETLARNASGRALVRVSNGAVRAVLSDSYKRIDSRPMINEFVQECQSQSLVPVDGHVSDTRISIKAVMVRPVELVAGEWLVLGISLQTSDYGAGAFDCSMFALRLLCLNGAKLESILRKVHLGRKLDEGTFSQKTYDLDAQTSQSAMRDVIKGALAPSNVDSIMDALRTSMEGGPQYSAKDRLSTLQRKGSLTKAEAKAIGEIYIEPDIEKLPAGNSDYRLSNAISWFAHDNKEHSVDRRLDLEDLAGNIMYGKV